MQFPQGDSLPHGKTRKKTTHVLFHESVTSSREATVEVLNKRGLSVHLIVDRDGSVTQHAPLDAACWHADALNSISVSIEVVNEYYGSRANEGDLVIAVPWAHLGKYIVPTPEQLEAAYQLAMSLCDKFKIPKAFPVVSKGIFRWSRIPGRDATTPGLHAHHETEHSDGLFPLHYCHARELGYDEEQAYLATLEAAVDTDRRTLLEPNS